MFNKIIFNGIADAVKWLFEGSILKLNLNFINALENKR